MDAKQRELCESIIEAQREIDFNYRVVNMIVNQYGEDELDEGLVEHLKLVAFGRVESASKRQQQAMDEYDTYLPS